MTIEKRIAHHHVPVGLGSTLQQDVDCRISLAIERWEEEDETAQDDASEEQFDIRILLQLGEESLAGRHGSHEVETHETAEYAQQDARRHTVELPWVGKREIEERFLTHQDITETGGRNTGDEDRQQRGHREIYHQHLEREDETCDWGFEDTSNGGTRTASYEQYHRFLVHAEYLSQITSDG